MMVGGALIAAAYDLSFDPFGYVLGIFSSLPLPSTYCNTNLFTNCNSIFQQSLHSVKWRVDEKGVHVREMFQNGSPFLQQSFLCNIYVLVLYCRGHLLNQHSIQRISLETWPTQQ